MTLVAFWFGTRMCVIGLTGGIACGKSTLCKELRDSGFSIVDCDEISHSIMKTDKSLIAEVAKNFPSAIDKDGVVDRTELGKIVFGDKKKI
jgi:dephospho-CoA kinase